MNYHDFYGPYQISGYNVFFKDVYRAFNMKKDAELIRNHASVQIADLESLLKKWASLLDRLNRMDEANYWNEEFRKDGLS
jgi:hypothetical protein